MKPMRGHLNNEIANLINKYCKSVDSATRIYDEEATSDYVSEPEDNVDSSSVNESTSNIEVSSADTNASYENLKDKMENFLGEELVTEHEASEDADADDNFIDRMLYSSEDKLDAMLNAVAENKVETEEIESESDSNSTTDEIYDKPEEPEDTFNENTELNKNEEETDNIDINYDNNENEDDNDEDDIVEDLNTFRKNLEDSDSEINIAAVFRSCNKLSDMLDIVEVLVEYGYTINTKNNVGGCTISEYLYTLEILAKQLTNDTIVIYDHIPEYLSLFNEDCPTALKALADRYCADYIEYKQAIYNLADLCVR